MPNPTVTDFLFKPAIYNQIAEPLPRRPHIIRTSPPTLAATITKQASAQTYNTIRFLADPQYRETAYQAYAYFRWVDDMVDRKEASKAERLAFLTRQQDLIACFYRGERPDNLIPIETLAASMIDHDTETNSGLQTYMNDMMATITFDAQRKGRIISDSELTSYTNALATAVTELLHYCIGHNDHAPQDESRYAAVTGAHITHLLRDTIEDVANGFYNIPQEYLAAHQINPTDLTHEAYRAWVKNRVEKARQCFDIGRTYMAQVENFRCRLAGYAYIGRFEIILNAIERDNYHLRPTYPERKTKTNALKIALKALSQTIKPSQDPCINTYLREQLSQ